MTQMVDINAEKFSVEKILGKNPLRKAKCRRENNVKIGPE